MIELPQWDPLFVSQAKRYTRRMNLYRVMHILILSTVPWMLARTVDSGSPLGRYTFRVILLFFGATVLLFLGERLLYDPKLRRKRRLVFRTVSAIPELSLLSLLSAYWWLVFPGHIALAIGAWWLGGLALAVSRYITRRWALREATLQTEDYRLFGHRVGKFTKRMKHDKASLYTLAEDSAFLSDAVMTLVGDEPKIYVGVQARRLLDPDELRAVIAHELGHSWSEHNVGYDLADWIRRLFLVPMLVAAGSALLAGGPAWLERHMVFAFLTMIVLIWQTNVWASYLLGRPRELAADRYAIEMTRTPQAFVGGLVKLAQVEPYYNVFPNLFDTLGLHAHPCVVRRVQRVAEAPVGRDQRSSRARLRHSARQ